MAENNNMPNQNTTKAPKATAALVLGIISAALSLFGSLFAISGLACGIIGIVFGSKAKKICAENSEYSDQKGKAQAGFICAIVGTAVAGICFLASL